MLEVGEVEAEPPMPPREPELEPGPAGPGLWICWPLGLAQSLAENVKYQRSIIIIIQTVKKKC